MKAANSFEKLFSIGSLGNVIASRGDIRAERLEDRIHPKVPFPHKHDFYQMVFIQSGRGQHRIDFESYSIRPAQIFVIQPGQVHSWELSKATRGYVVEFTSESFSSGLFSSPIEALARVKSMPEQTVVSAQAFKNIRTFLEKMVLETNFSEADSKAYLLNSLGIILIEISRLQNAIRKPTSTLKLEIRFMELVEENYKIERSLDFYSNTLGVSSKNLANAVRRAHGVSPKEVIQNRRLLEAKRLLAYSTSTIAEVGYEIGFEDPNYFSRFFAKHAKLKAQAFRDKFKKN